MARGLDLHHQNWKIHEQNRVLHWIKVGRCWNKGSNAIGWKMLLLSKQYLGFVIQVAAGCNIE